MCNSLCNIHRRPNIEHILACCFTTKHRPFLQLQRRTRPHGEPCAAALALRSSPGAAGTAPGRIVRHIQLQQQPQDLRLQNRGRTLCGVLHGRCVTFVRQQRRLQLAAQPVAQHHLQSWAAVLYVADGACLQALLSLDSNAATSCSFAAARHQDNQRVHSLPSAWLQHYVMGRL